jgi:hypothetical protein
MSIDLLATANPVPAPAAVEDDELFARIVALPRGQATRRRPRKRVAVAIVLAVAAVLTSTAVGVDHWLTGAVKPDVTLAEYRAAQSLVPLPPGATWPTLHVDPNSMTTRGGGGGYAVEIATTKWECYWAAAIRTGDTAGQRRANTVLHALLRDHAVIKPDAAPEDWVPASPPAFPYVVFADDGGYQFQLRIWAQAAAGDPSGVAQSCRANS